MKRGYLCLKSAPKIGWKQGETYFMEERDAGRFVKNGTLREDSTDPTTLVVRAAVREYEKQRGPSRDREIAKILDEVDAKLWNGKNNPHESMGSAFLRRKAEDRAANERTERVLTN